MHFFFYQWIQVSNLFSDFMRSEQAAGVFESSTQNTRGANKGWEKKRKQREQTRETEGGVNARKGEYKAIRYGYCESSGETRNSKPLHISYFFLGSVLLRGLHLHRWDILF